MRPSQRRRKELGTATGDQGEAGCRLEGNVGAAFAESSGLVRSARVGQATARLMPQRDLVEFAASWFPAHRDATMFAQDTTSWDADNDGIMCL
ncbi:MAG TPA: AAC(3) family N-acetyltransferase [Coriobacteriia bacterium]|nr:AAC(3) family N-acetyltransferase [Coriobacteriia bacterium]